MYDLLSTRCGNRYFTAYFIVNEPAKGGQWVNGVANHVSWTKGLLDDVSSFDVEMSRMSVDGLIYVASYGTSDPLSHSFLLDFSLGFSFLRATPLSSAPDDGSRGTLPL